MSTETNIRTQMLAEDLPHAAEALPGDLLQGEGSPAPPGGPDSSTDLERLTISKPKSLITNGLWSLILTAWNTGVTFFLTPFLIARIGTDHYGLFILLMSISGMMGLMNLGLGEATLRYVAYYYGRNDMAGINRVVRATLSVYLVAAMMAWAALFLAASPIAHLLSLPLADRALAASLLRLTAISLGLGFFAGAFGSIPQALQRFDITTTMGITQSTFQVVGTVAILLYGAGVYELVLWGVVTSLFTQAVNMIVAKRLLPALTIWPWPSRAGLKEVFGYGVWSLVTQVCGTIWLQADRLLLGVFANPTAVGYLSVPHTLNFRAMDLVSSASAGLFPRFSMPRDDATRSKLFLNATWVMMLCSITVYVPLTVVLPDFLRLWISPEFAAASAFVGQLIAASCLVRGTALVYQPLLRGMNRPHIVSVVTIAAASISLVVNVALIPRLGVAGAGYSYIATAGLCLIMAVYTWRRVLGIPSSRILLRTIALPAAIGYLILAMGMWVHTLVPVEGWVGLVAMGVAIAAAAAGSVLVCELLLGGDNNATALLERVKRTASSLVERCH